MARISSEFSISWTEATYWIIRKFCFSTFWNILSGIIQTSENDGKKKEKKLSLLTFESKCLVQAVEYKF